MMRGQTLDAITAFVAAGGAAAVTAVVLPAPPTMVVVAVPLVVASAEVVLSRRRERSEAIEAPSDSGPGDLTGHAHEAAEPPEVDAKIEGDDMGDLPTADVGAHVDDGGGLAPARRAPTSLADYRGGGRRGRQPQCPKCGRFQVENTRRDETYRFTCQSCSASWSWSAGQPWPRVLPLANLQKPTKGE